MTPRFVVEEVPGGINTIKLVGVKPASNVKFDNTPEDRALSLNEALANIEKRHSALASHNARSESYVSRATKAQRQLEKINNAPTPERMRQLRRCLGWSQADLGRNIGYSRGSIAQAELHRNKLPHIRVRAVKYLLDFAHQHNMKVPPDNA